MIVIMLSQEILVTALSRVEEYDFVDQLKDVSATVTALICLYRTPAGSCVISHLRLVTSLNMQLMKLFKSYANYTPNSCTAI